jgi:hypothetical protein
MLSPVIRIVLPKSSSVNEWPVISALKFVTPIENDDGAATTSDAVVGAEERHPQVPQPRFHEHHVK